jgi:protein-tyrosine-phosphatase
VTDLQDTFDVVFICTGNRFRSVLAEHQLRQATAGLPVHVSSFGTLDEPDVAALADAVELGAAAGLDLGEHRSRPLLGQDLRAADLVVGFERNHVASAVVEAGAPRDKTFGAYELVELLARIESPGELSVPERARNAVARAHAGRADSKRPFRELADPVGRGTSFAAETAAQVRDQVARIAFGLFGTGPAAPPVDPPAPAAGPGHLLFVWASAGWRLEQRDGDPPAVGDIIEADGKTLIVTGLGRSPLPGDRRRCAYTQPL